MGIAHDVIEKFSTVLDVMAAKASRSSGTSVMAECVEVDENGVPWVRILGSESATPATTRLATAQKGDLVTMNIRAGKAVLNGNLTSPSCTQREYESLKQVTVTEIANIKEAMVDRAVVKELIAGSAVIRELYADVADIEEVIADVMTAEYADLHYAQIDAANINTATIRSEWVDQIMVQTGLLAQTGTVFTLDAIQLNADRITAGTIDIQRIIVTDSTTGEKSMITWNSSTQQYDAVKLDGDVLGDHTVSADKIIAHSLTANEITTNNIAGTGGWINLASGTFSYVNATSGDGIAWDGTNLTINAASLTAQINTAVNTYVRAYGNGVLVCKSSQSVGALVNADGSFDVVPVTWSNGTPTVGTPMSTFGASAARVGKSEEGHVELTEDAIRLGYGDLTPFEVMAVEERTIVSESTESVWFEISPTSSNYPRTKVIKKVDDEYSVSYAGNAFIDIDSNMQTQSSNIDGITQTVTSIVTDEVTDVDYSLPSYATLRRTYIECEASQQVDESGNYYVLDLEWNTDLAADIAAAGTPSLGQGYFFNATFKFATYSSAAPSIGDSLAVRIGGRGTVPVYKYKSKPVATSLPSFPCVVATDDGAAYLGMKSNGTATLTRIDGSVTGVKGDAESTYRTGDVNITPANIGASASDHAHGLLHSDLTATITNTTTDSGWSMINSTYNGFLLKSIRFNGSSPNWGVGNYGAGVCFGGSDTKGVVSLAYNSPSIKFAGGNGTAPVWWINVTGTSGKAYNLNSSVTNITRSGTTFTATKADGSTFTFTQQDNNTTYSCNTARGTAMSGTEIRLGRVVVYNNASGTNGTVSWSNNAVSSYNHMRIFYRINDHDARQSVDIVDPSGRTALLAGVQPRSGTGGYIKCRRVSMSGSSVSTHAPSGWSGYAQFGLGGLGSEASNYVFIVRVEMWNE